jgi:toxin CcdB
VNGGLSWSRSRATSWFERASSGTFADRLNPRVQVDGEAFVLVIQELVTVRKSMLGNARASIAGERDAIIAALDLLFTGF